MRDFWHYEKNQPKESGKGPLQFKVKQPLCGPIWYVSIPSYYALSFANQKSFFVKRADSYLLGGNYVRENILRVKLLSHHYFPPKKKTLLSCPARIVKIHRRA